MSIICVEVTVRINGERCIGEICASSSFQFTTVSPRIKFDLQIFHTAMIDYPHPKVLERLLQSICSLVDVVVFVVDGWKKKKQLWNIDGG